MVVLHRLHDLVEEEANGGSKVGKAHKEERQMVWSLVVLGWQVSGRAMAPVHLCRCGDYCRVFASGRH